MDMINIVPIFPDAPEFAISEIRRQEKEIGLKKFAISLSFHPQRNTARTLIPELCSLFSVVRDGLAGIDIELGVLIQSTQGHGWNGKISLTQEKWQKIVALDGTETPRMCPADPDFRAYVCDAIAAVCREHAAFLIIDDDFGLRTFECFCPLHVAAYSKAIGRECSISDLRKIITERPWNDPDVMKISEIRKQTAVSFACEIRRAIDSVNPEIRCGYCTPWAGHGFFREVSLALAGRTRPFVRVNNAIYGMQNPLAAYRLTATTARVKNLLDGIDDVIDESDTFPQCYYSESAAAFHSHITMAVLNGLTGCKLWTSEFERPVNIGSQRHYEQRLADYGGFYNELQRCVQGVKWHGISGMLFKPQHLAHPIMDGCITQVDDWCQNLLGPFAFPIRFERVSADGIFSLAGTAVNYFSDDEIRTLLSKAVLIDSIAAKCLTKRGFAPLIGVEASDGDEKFSFDSEECPRRRLSVGLMWDESAAQLSPVDSAVSVETWFRRGIVRASKGTHIAPGMTFFRNSLGGKVVVTGWAVSIPFYKSFRPMRREFLMDALDWLSGGFMEMSVEAGWQFLVNHGTMADGNELVAAINLALDSADDLLLRMRRDPKSIELLNSNGGWSSVRFCRTSADIVAVAVRAVCFEPLVLKLKF